jgi:hypothetical protein
MALKPEEIKKINDLFVQIDLKDVEIKSIRNELSIANTTINYLNTTLESNKLMIVEMDKKLDIIIELVNSSTTTKVAKTVK